MEDIVFNAGTISEALNNKVDLPSAPPRGQDEIDYVVDWQVPTAENSYTWYRKYKSGWVEQGGSVENVNENTRVITLPVPMADSNYMRLLTVHQNAATAPAFAYIRNITSSNNIEFKSSSQNTITTVYWEVKGYAA